mgnify:CR=1 FL=1
MRKILVASAALLAMASNVQAAEIKALITTAMDAAVVVLIPQFEKASGHKVSYSYDPSGGLARRLRGGEFADMILVASPELDKLIAEGKVTGPRVDISRTGIGIAVKKGAPHPDVSTAEALRRTLLAAKSVGHTAPAGGGITALHLLRTFEKLGVAKEVAAKTKLAAGGPNGRVSTLIVNGDVENADAGVLHLREAATTVVGDPQVGAEQVPGARVEEAQVADRAGGLDEGLRVALRGRHVGLREGVHLLPGAAAVLGAQQGRAGCARARRLRERELGLAEAR